MTKFFLKKNFMDSWDNIIQLLIPNLIIIGLIAGSFFATSYFATLTDNRLLPFFLFGLLFAFTMIFIFAWGRNACEIADFGLPKLKNYFKSIPASILPGFGYGLCISAVFIFAMCSLPFYWRWFRNGQWLGLIIGAFVVWFLIISLISLEWFIPLYFLQSDNGFFKTLKKCFIIFFDNPLFSIYIFFYNIVIFICSSVLVFTIPGVTGVVLSQMNALRLRLKKYDWWEEHPEIAQNPDERYEIPWDELLADDMEALGPFKLRSIIFPWSR